MIYHLMDNEFDISHAKKLRMDRGEGHAFGLVHRRLMHNSIVPIVPIALNTYPPPNQPRPKQCYNLGRSIRDAVENWESDARVRILGSGGLSHFTIDEELDCGMLRSVKEHDADALSSIPLEKLNAGNSEIRNWISIASGAEYLNLLGWYIPRSTIPSLELDAPWPPR